MISLRHHEASEVVPVKGMLSSSFSGKFYSRSEGFKFRRVNFEGVEILSTSIHLTSRVAAQLSGRYAHHSDGNVATIYKQEAVKWRENCRASVDHDLKFADFDAKPEVISAPKDGHSIDTGSRLAVSHVFSRQRLVGLSEINMPGH